MVHVILGAASLIERGPKRPNSPNLFANNRCRYKLNQNCLQLSGEKQLGFSKDGVTFKQRKQKWHLGYRKSFKNVFMGNNTFQTTTFAMKLYKVWI